MKVLKIVLISIVALIVLMTAGLFVFIKTMDVNKYLPQITQQIGQAVNREVSIHNLTLDLSLSRGLSLTMNNLIIKDDKKFSDREFLNLPKVSLGVELMPLLTKQQIHISNVILSAPHLAVIRTADGVINAQTMVPAPSAGSAASVNPSSSATASAPAPAAALPNISVNSIAVEDGELYFEDKNPQLPIKLTVKNIQVKVSDFSLTENFNFSATLNALAKNNSNVDIKGRCTLNLAKNNAAYISDLTITSDLSQLDLSQVKAVTTLLQTLPVWPQDVKGSLVISIPQLNASAKGLDKIDLTAKLSNGYIKLKEILKPVESINATVTTDLIKMDIKSLDARLGAGEITAKGKIMGLTTLPSYNFDLQTKGIKVEELVDESAWPASLKGNFVSDLAISGSSFEPEAMMNNLKGSGSFNLADARIENFNILDIIVKKLSFIPGLGDQITAQLSPSVKEKLNTNTTLIDKAGAKVDIAHKTVTISNGQMDSKLFSVNAAGTLGFDLSANIDVKTSLAADISADLVKSSAALTGLLDEQKRITVPGKVSGQGSSIKYVPEVSDLAKKAAMAEGASQLGKVLDKNPEVKNILSSILGGGAVPANNQANDNSAATNEQPKEKSSEELVNDLFGAFSKKKKN